MTSRGSPALEIWLRRLLLQGYEVEAVEPHISSHPTIKLTDLSSISGENIIPVVLVKTHQIFSPGNQVSIENRWSPGFLRKP